MEINKAYMMIFRDENPYFSIDDLDEEDLKWFEQLSEEDCKVFVTIRERERYRKKLRRKYNDVSYQSLETDNISGDNTIIDYTENIEDRVIRKIMSEMVMNSLYALSHSDRYLIKLLTINGFSEREVAKMFNVNRNVIHKKKVRILSYLKKILKL